MSKPDTTSAQRRSSESKPTQQELEASIRAENEDDDGYDPYSDRPATAEPLFEADPWR